MTAPLDPVTWLILIYRLPAHSGAEGGDPAEGDRRRVPLCVRHLLGLRALDPWAGHVTAGGAVERADILIAELNEAFSKNTWAHRHEPRGPEMTAWRRAAALAAGSTRTQEAGGCQLAGMP